jgi:hypothetical protein
MNDHDDNMMCVLYKEDGRSLEELARFFECAVSTVRYRLLSHGVRMRRQGRPRRVLKLALPVREAESC